MLQVTGERFIGLVLKYCRELAQFEFFKMADENEENGGQRQTLEEVLGDQQDPIVGYKKKKMDFNWRERTLAHDADSLIVVHSLLDGRDERV